MDIVNEYVQLNQSFKQQVVFKLGIGGGFFSEYNNMLVSILYCLQHRIQFKLDSSGANFSFEKGWTDYFKPFCEEILDDNCHYKTVDWRYLVKSILQGRKIDISKNLLPYFHYNRKMLLTQDIFGKARSSVAQNRIYDFPSLKICGNFRQACGALLKMTWCYNKEVESELEDIIQDLHLPSEYVSLQIRGGDKILEHQLFSIDRYFEKLESERVKCRNIFILTDDYNIFENCRIKYPNKEFWTLCEKEDRGYSNSQFVNQSPLVKRRKLIRLFAAIEIMTTSLLFIGTYTANPGLFLGMRIPNKAVSIDQEWRIW